MNVSFKMAISYLKQNKKRTLGTAIGIIIVTTLIISIFLILNVYQNSMINIKRSTDNWEVRFNNISYDKILGFTENSDIKDVTLTQDIGKTYIEFEKEGMEKYLDIKAYDQNAFKIFGIKLLEGRFPQKSDEIVLSKNFPRKQDKIKVNIDGKDYEYKVVGIIEETPYDVVNLNAITTGAITYLDKNILDPTSTINVSVNYYDTKNTYTLSEELVNVFHLYNNEEDKNKNIEFNTDLLHYYSIWDMNNVTDRTIVIIAFSLISLIILTSITLIHSIFNISTIERKKEFAILNSLGATSNQIIKIVLYELGILLLISIILGLLLSIGILNLSSYYLNNITMDTNLYVTNALESTMIDIPYMKILIGLLLIVITSIIAVIIPAVKAGKSSILEEIKGKNSLKIKNKILNRKYKSIQKTLYFRDIKQNSYKHKTIIISVTISIFLFLLTQAYYNNIKNVMDNEYVCNYTVDVEGKYAEEIKQSFIETGDIKSIYSYMVDSFFTQIDESNINDSLKQACIKCPKMKEQVFFTSIENELKCNVYALNNKEFKTYLQKNGLDKLKDNECILLNYSVASTDYYDGVYMTNYNEGETIEIYLNSKGDGTFEIDSINNIDNIDDTNFTKYGDNQRKFDLEIAKVVNDFPSTIKPISGEIPELCIIVSEDGLNNLKKYLLNAEKPEDNYTGVRTVIDVYSENREVLDKVLEKIRLKYGIKYETEMGGIYLDPEYNLKEIRVSQFFLQSITILITVITVINIINIIVNEINSKMRYFSILTSIGMTKQQLNKMIFKEYARDLFISLFLGTTMSILFAYIIYLNIYNHELYIFKIPFVEILIIALMLLIILFFIIHYINRAWKKNSIISLIRSREM